MTKLNISEQEYKNLRRLGMSKEQIVQKHSAAAAPAKTPISTKVTNALGLRGTVDYLGTVGANLANPKLGSQGFIPQPTMKQAVGAGFQLGSLTAPTTSAAPLLKSLGAGALSGAAALGGQAATENKDAPTIATQATLGAALGGGINAAAKSLTSTGKATFKFFIPRSKQEAAMLQAYQAKTPFAKRIAAAALGDEKAPRLAAETAFDKGLIGTEPMMGVQARRAQQKLWSKLVGPALDQAKEPVNLNNLFATTRQQIIAQNPELTRQKSLLRALDSIVEDYKGTQTVSYKQLQDIKSGWAQFVPEKKYRGEDIAGALNEVRATLASSARTQIYDRLGPAVQQAYIDYGNLHALAQLGQTAMTGQKRMGGSGGLIQWVIEKFIVPISTVAGQTVYKAGKGIELIGRPGLNTVGQFVLDLTSESDQQPDIQATGTGTPQAMTSDKPTIAPVPVQQSPFTDLGPAALDPGGKIIQPALEQAGIDPRAAAIAGTIGGLAAPSPLGKAKAAVKGGESAIRAGEQLKDELIALLGKGSPTFSKGMNLPANIADEAQYALKNLKNKANPSDDDFRDALEVARLLGHNVSTIADDYIRAMQTSVEQLRDKLGRYTSQFR